MNILDQQIMPVQLEDYDHTVRAPQVRSTMHDKNTIKTSETISVQLFKLQGEKAHFVCAAT